jgi:hypothetical protein
MDPQLYLDQTIDSLGFKLTVSATSSMTQPQQQQRWSPTMLTQSPVLNTAWSPSSLFTAMNSTPDPLLLPPAAAMSQLPILDLSQAPAAAAAAPRTNVARRSSLPPPPPTLPNAAEDLANTLEHSRENIDRDAGLGQMSQPEFCSSLSRVLRGGAAEVQRVTCSIENLAVAIADAQASVKLALILSTAIKYHQDPSNRPMRYFHANGFADQRETAAGVEIGTALWLLTIASERRTGEPVCINDDEVS